MTTRNEPPSNLNHLNKLIETSAGTTEAAVIRIRSIATVVTCQMLPMDVEAEGFASIVKGGTAMK
jgi:hypothetical protein